MSKTKDKKNHDEDEVKVESPENAEMPADEKQVEEQIEEKDSKEEDETDRLKTELGEAKDKYLRLYSEFENFRRRSARERLDLVQTANQELVRELLPVIDDFERAMQSHDGEDESNSQKEGMELIYNKLQRVLQQKGVKPMDSEQGIDFDPEIHEAISQIPAPKEELKGKVVEVVEKGYYLNDKVVRFAKVVIGG